MSATVYAVANQKSIPFAESPRAGRSILARDPSGPGAAAYRYIAAELAGAF